MQGTVVMLMALSGLGCHAKHAAPVSSCYSSSCYSSACYSGSSCYSSGYAPVLSYSANVGGCGTCETAMPASCYSSCYSSSCYSSACYSGGGHGHKAKKRAGGLFGCFRKKHMSAGCDTCSMGVVGDLGYSAPVFGSYTDVVPSGQYLSSGQGYSAPTMMSAPAPAPAPAAAAPAPPVPAANETPVPPTPAPEAVVPPAPEPAAPGAAPSTAPEPKSAF
jgi:hypothetical protein